jgi:UDP-N-acetylglucosamine 2-epimerase (non-hydrolysing)
MKIAIVLGTRPEIIKMSSLIREAGRRKLDFFIIHSNQHYSPEMDKIFFDELELPQPKYNLNVGSGSHAEMTAEILTGAEKILIDEKPDIIFVQGDTNTVMAAALAASKLGIKVAHIEAGLRSYDREMPEEVNRIVTDHISDYLFPPTEKSSEILEKEGIEKSKIFMVGNTVVDAVYQNLEIAENKVDILKHLGIKSGQYFLLTMHRPSNVDDKKSLKNILEALGEVVSAYGLPIIFPIHPRTKKQLEKFGLSLPEGVREIAPVGFLEMLQLEKNAKLIITDSGGIQEEACILKIPSVTLRKNTERPETVEAGASILAGNDAPKIIAAVRKMINMKTAWKNPFGKGRSAEHILEATNSKTRAKIAI